ncbi:hypothetical protein AAZX31_15G228000 [Glycine max]|nr:hypothetical protein GLYMA_15G242050v4 [Glycine max]KAH1148662.1 hypothetical protein GYH30_043340 [Glycine max]
MRKNLIYLRVLISSNILLSLLFEHLLRTSNFGYSVSYFYYQKINCLLCSSYFEIQKPLPCKNGCTYHCASTAI